MKQKLLDFRSVYQAPEISEVDLTSEGILCASGSIEDYEFVEDVNGWLS
jgi:hypothetical protein